MRTAAVLLGLAFVANTSAQTTPAPLRLLVLDGRNGRPVQNEDISLWYDEKEGTPTLLHTDAHGEAQVPPPLATAVRITVEPMVSVDCRPKHDGPIFYSLRIIHERGLAAENKCGTPVFRKHLNELILFVRDHKWYEGFNQ
ncbi:MAG: hypothetical protein JSS87_12350 [Acidobacteria bacterium]|nr:hypothetical protein [Acidobacteriota bacterium]